MREQREKTSKDTHFYPEQENNYSGRLQKLYSGYRSEGSDEGWHSFVIGYFMHVMTDYYWFRSVHPQFVEQVREDDQREGIVRTKEEVSCLYYQETDQIDVNLYQNAGWSKEVWSALNGTSGYDMTDRLTANEIERWRDRTFTFFAWERAWNCTVLHYRRDRTSLCRQNGPALNRFIR